MASATAEEVFEQVVKPLPLSERLKLAQLILNAIPPQSVIDYGDAWSDDDIRDFTSASWRHADARIEAEDRDAETG